MPRAKEVFVTATTRRRIVVCVVAMVLTLPIETVLLKAISTPSSTDAIRAWVNKLDPDSLDQAAGQVQSYPFAYRKEILRAVSKDKRVRVWVKHITAYREAHPGLEPEAVALLDKAVA